MGISGFFGVEWVPHANFSENWRYKRRRARIAIDILSFAIGSELVVNSEILSIRLNNILSKIGYVFFIERVALFVDGRPTHNLKRAEQDRRRSATNVATKKQLAYVKGCSWKKQVLDNIAHRLNIDPKNVTLDMGDGEADIKIFKEFKNWGIESMDVDNIIISSDSDVFFMSLFASQITWFVRRAPGPLRRFNTTTQNSIEKTRMLKFATLNKTDFYNVLYGGKYDDPCPDAIWDPSHLQEFTHQILTWCRDVLVSYSRVKRPPSDAPRQHVISVMARRVWFLRVATGHPTLIDEDAALTSHCPKKDVVGILVNNTIEDIVNDILAIVTENKENVSYSCSLFC